MEKQTKIIEKIEMYKNQRQKWIDKQINYRWTDEEKRNGSQTYGYYQEKEQLFTALISELEWVLVIFKKESSKIV